MALTAAASAGPADQNSMEETTVIQTLQKCKPPPIVAMGGAGDGRTGWLANRPLSSRNQLAALASGGVAVDLRTRRSWRVKLDRKPRRCQADRVDTLHRPNLAV